jgi:hypothetical protein
MPTVSASPVTSWDGIIFEAATDLVRAYRLLEQLGRTTPQDSGRWTFFEVDDAIRCVSRALLALDTAPRQAARGDPGPGHIDD